MDSKKRLVVEIIKYIFLNKLFSLFYYLDVEANLKNKIEKLPTVQDLQIIEEQNPPWINLENNSYVLAVSGIFFF